MRKKKENCEKGGGGGGAGKTTPLACFPPLSLSSLSLPSLSPHLSLARSLSLSLSVCLLCAVRACPASLSLSLPSHLDQVVVFVPGQGGRPAVPAHDGAVARAAGGRRPVDAQAPARALCQLKVAGRAGAARAPPGLAGAPVLVVGVHGGDGGHEGGDRHARRGRRRAGGVGHRHDRAPVHVALQLHARRGVGVGRGGRRAGGGLAAVGGGQEGVRGLQGVVDLEEERERGWRWRGVERLGEKKSG